MRRVLPLSLIALVCCGSPVIPGLVKSQSIGSGGGTITISDSESSTLAGTSITIPAGALKSSVNITIALSSQPVTPTGAVAAGPVVEFGPDGTTFAQPASITIPLQLPEGDETWHVSVEAVESNGMSLNLPGDVSYDQKSVAFQASGFTRFGAIDSSPDGGTTDGGQDAGPTCSCPVIEGTACTGTGPGPCFCPLDVPCDGGPGPTIDAGPPVCSCPEIPSDACLGTGPGPCFCPVAEPCDGGTDAGTDGGVQCTDDSDCPVEFDVCIQGQCVAEPCCTVPDGGQQCATAADCGGCPWVCSDGMCEATTIDCPADGGPAPEDAGPVVCGCPAVPSGCDAGVGPGPCFCPNACPFDAGG